MKKVTFIFPPFLPSASKSPYLAPHLLTTLLREKGHEVENLDLNNQFVRRMGKRHVLEAADAAKVELTQEEVELLERLADATGVDTRGEWEHTME